MNDLYTRDRMERNASDYEGSGIGSGRYDPRQERSEKLKEITLPIVLLLVIAVAWAALLYESYPHLYFVVMGEKAEGEVVAVSDGSGARNVVWTAPDGEIRSFIVPSEVRVKNGKVDVYYINGDYNTGSAVFPIEYWAPYYIVMILVTVGLILWIKRTLFKKKHATYEKREHSYKDY